MTRAVKTVAKEIATYHEELRDKWNLRRSNPHLGVELEHRLEKATSKWLLLLCPPRKSPRVRSKGVKTSRATTKELDKLCREVVFLRDGNKCKKCGRTERLQWCHVYSRRYKWLRWDLDNSFCGCARCHLEWHHRPADGAEWWCGLMKERWTPLVRRASKPQKADPVKWKLYLEAEKKKLEGAPE